MAFTDVINRLFGKDGNGSKDVAKERLRLVLVHDRADMSQDVMNHLREDLIAVINKYMEIDQDALEVSMNNEDGTASLVANIPILSVKRNIS